MTRVLATLLPAMLVLASCAEERGGDRAPGRVTATTEGVTATAEVSALGVPVVERVDLTLEVSHEPGLGVEMPEIGETLGGFTVRDRYERPRAFREGRAVRVIGVTLEPFLPGEYELPELVVSVDRDELIERLAVRPPTITVTSVIEGSPEAASIGEPAGIIEPAEAEERSLAWAVIAGAGIALMALIAVLVWRATRRSAPEAHADPVLAGLAELDEIEKGLVSGDVGAKQATGRAAAILRIALADRLDPRAVSMTGEEIARSLHARGRMSASAFELLSGVCRRLDGAAYAPSSDTGADRERARELVGDVARVLSSLPRSRPEAEAEPEPAGRHGRHEQELAPV